MKPTPRCWFCQRFMPPRSPSWLLHRTGCDRAYNGQCGCAQDNRWACQTIACIQSRPRGAARNRLTYSPLIDAIRAAHNTEIARQEAA